jgi:lipopolysaccharide transport system permease protein
MYWADLWRHRELFYFLSWRDIVVRYKQTVIGIAWSVIRPLLTMLVFTVVFGRLAKFPSGGVPYPLLVLAGLLPWQLVATSMADASASLIANANLLTKVYFPRLVIPASSVMTGVVDFAISMAILVVMMAYYRFVPPLQILLLPAFVVLATAFSLGVGLVFCALNVKYRDFRYIIPFLLQLGLYISPVGFSSGAIPQKWRLLYSLNPMAGIIDGFRWAILGGENQIYMPGLLLSVLVSALLLWYGIVMFRRTERTFADII